MGQRWEGSKWFSKEWVCRDPLCVCVMGLVCVQSSDWSGAVGLRGSHARYQQWEILGVGEHGYWIQWVSSFSYVRNPRCGWTLKKSIPLYEYIFFPGAENSTKPLVEVAFVCLCESMWLAIYICIYPYIYCFMCVLLYMPVGNMRSALLMAGPGNTELRQPRLFGYGPWYIPAKLCGRADVALELLAFVSSESIWLSKP